MVFYHGLSQIRYDAQLYCYTMHNFTVMTSCV